MKNECRNLIFLLFSTTSRGLTKKKKKNAELPKPSTDCFIPTCFYRRQRLSVHFDLWLVPLSPKSLKSINLSSLFFLIIRRSWGYTARILRGKEAFSGLIKFTAYMKYKLSKTFLTFRKNIL